MVKWNGTTFGLTLALILVRPYLQIVAKCLTTIEIQVVNYNGGFSLVSVPPLVLLLQEEVSVIVPGLP